MRIRPKNTVTLPSCIFTVRMSPPLEGDSALNLVLENTRTRARLTLEEPVLENLRSLLQIEKPKSGVLGFAQTMNPFQQGGLWDVLRTGWRYRKCIQLRKQAKKEFELRFARDPSRFR